MSPNTRQPGPFPLETLRRVERPTTIITEAIGRIDMRDNAYGLAARGDYGPAVQKGVRRSLPEKYPLSAAQKDIIDHIAGVRANPAAGEKAPIPRDPTTLTHHVKALGYFLKADIVGTCEVPQSAFYSHDKRGNAIDAWPAKAIIIVMRKDWKTMNASTGSDWAGDPISFQAYQHLGMAAETIANYLRRLGWAASAQYGPSLVNQYSVLLPPLLLAAGIGEVSRAGIVLNPFLGLGFKAAAILTDMPLIPDKPIDFGLQSFCQRCTICAQNCPSRAISMGDRVMYNGYETWKLDTRRCASFNFTNKSGTMCNRCVKSCPWSNPPTWPHNLVRSAVMRSRLAQRVAIRAAHLLGQEREHPEDKWWFDMEYEDEVIQLRE